MSLVIANVGRERQLQYAVGKTAVANIILRLFVNDTVPTVTSTQSSFTECTLAGYSAKTLTGSSWTVTTSVPYQAYYATQTWTFTGPPDETGIIYGYYMLWSGVLLAAERFSTPIEILYWGETISITPRLHHG